MHSNALDSLVKAIQEALGGFLDGRDVNPKDLERLKGIWNAVVQASSASVWPKKLLRQRLSFRDTSTETVIHLALHLVQRVPHAKLRKRRPRCQGTFIQTALTRELGAMRRSGFLYGCREIGGASNVIVSLCWEPLPGYGRTRRVP